MVRRASPTTAAAVSALCLIVLAQSTLRPTATTSLPVQLGPSVSFQQHPPSTEAAGTIDQPQPQLAFQLALVSARGPLAFWRPAPDESSTAAAALASLESNQAQQQQQQQQQQPHNSRPSQQIINNHSKCPQLSSSSSSSSTNGIGIISSSSKASSSAELLAVEGSNLKLNFVIVGSLRLAPNAKQAASSGQQQQQQLAAGSKLSFRWTKNGQPLSVISALQQQQQQQQNSNKQRSGSNQFQRHQFGELIINENDIIRRYFANLPASQSQSSFSSLSSGSNGSSSSERVSTSDDDGSPDSSRFVLAPHFDERLIGRLKLDSQLDSLLRPLRRETSSRLFASNHRQPQQLADDFLADAQLIDWPRLETHLKQNANQLRLYLPPDQSSWSSAAAATVAAGASAAPKSVLTAPAECPQLSPQIEQLTIVQLETPVRLTTQDAGLYTLEACTGRACQSLAFRVHVAQDWPILERTFEHQILEPGDRLSIKCEATGFTLPQITWFLDGQQLNEHKSSSNRPPQQHDAADSVAAAVAADDADDVTLTTTASNLRVGDYVSQDNHVHSFVNASRLQASDGGLYRCQANNGFHLVEHEARIDVRGPATFARQLSNQSLLLSGESQLRVQCPFSGYPIATIEWFFKPSPAKHDSALLGPLSSHASPLTLAGDLSEEYFSAAQRRYLSNSGRSKRLSQQPAADQMLGPSSPKLDATSSLDEDREPDPQGDEWLAQASAPTPPPDPPNLDDYPSDYLLPAAASFDDADAGGSSYGPVDFVDYADLQMDTQQQQQSVLDRRRRDTSGSGGGDGAADWVKLPQSRRHQVHQNGTLIVQELSRNDQGFYKCRVGSDSGSGSRLISSNEFHLSIMVPPVISPFSSAETLREGMRNFLTCSVIEGDSPIRLSWLKDNQPIEDYMERSVSPLSSSSSSIRENQDNNDDSVAFEDPSDQQQQQQQRASSLQQRRIRVETSNEYTSTLYFSHVDFRDNGNYTCMATNKAASVNYTARMLVNVPPKWVKVPKDIEFTAGQNMVIDCQAKAYPSARVWWEIGISGESNAPNNNSNKTSSSKASTAAQGGSNHPPLHYRTIISNSRIHILENASLVIRDLQPSDQGYYLCQASNNFGSLSSLIKLTVNVGASFTSKYLLKYAKLGERVELDCDPNGQSPIEIGWFWRHHQQQQSAAATSASQSSSRASSSGTTLFPNTTSLGQRLFTGLLQGNEQSSPSQTSQWQSSSSSMVVGDGGADSMESAAAAPEAASQAKISFEVMTTAGRQPAAESVRLIIGAATRQHSAEFICRASNRYGSDEKLTKLLVQEPPDQVRDLQPVQVDSRSVSVSWPVPYSGNSPITGYTVEWSPQSQSQSQSQNKKWFHLQVQQPAVVLTGLSPQTSYEVKVRAHNQLGQSLAPDSSPPLVVTTAEEAPNVPPSDIRAQPLSSSSIQLSWSVGAATGGSSSESQQTAKLQPSIKGYYLGYRLANSSTSSSSSSSSSTSSDSYVFKTVPLESGAGSTFASDVDQRNASTSTAAAEGGQQQQRIKVLIDDLKRATRYSIIVYAFNSAGSGPQSDPIETRTLLDDPPPMPMLRVGSVTFTSIELEWNFPPTNNNNNNDNYHYHHHSSSNLLADQYPESQNLPPPSKRHNNNTVSGGGADDDERDRGALIIDGYQLYYRSTTRSQSSVWLEKKLRPESHTMLSFNSKLRHDIVIVDSSSPQSGQTMQPSSSSPHLLQHQTIGWQRSAGSPLTTTRFTLDQLMCGNSYQIYLIAYNSIGSGQPSQSVRTKTHGSAPIAPRKHDFILPNSTLALLNLDTWTDGGCSISNFEIRYKQRDPARPLQSPTATVGGGGGGSESSQPWLLVASQISPEQRQLELRDLQPESWYSVWVMAESAAGKSEAQYTFMTLDKFGRMPLEALEMSAADSTQPTSSGTNGGMHALLSRYGNGSLVRSLLYNFSSATTGAANNAVVSPMLMSACLALILFATCSLFLIRRYNRQQQQFASSSTRGHHSLGANTSKDNGSSIGVDSDGGGRLFAGSSLSHYHSSAGRAPPRMACAGQVGPSTANTAAQVIGGEHLRSASEAAVSEDYDHLNSVGGGAMLVGHNNNNNNSSASPCKTSTTILTGSSSHSNGSSSTQGFPMCGGSGSGGGLSSFRSSQAQSGQLDLSRFMGDVAAAAAAAAAASNNNNNTYVQPSQFNSATLAHHFNHPQHQFACDEAADTMTDAGGGGGTLKLANLPADLMQRFRTMPHQRATNCDRGQYAAAAYCQATTDDQYNQQIQFEQQQIYAKLRLLQCNNNNNNNYCQQPEQQPVYDANTINLAVLSQQHHHQKLLTAANSCTLGKRQQASNCAAAGSCNLQSPADQQLDCAGQQQLLEATLDSYGQQQQQQQQLYDQTTGCVGPAPVEANGTGYGPAAYGQVGGCSSIVSGSTSSSSANNTSSALPCTDGSHASQQQEQQLISLTNEVNAIGNQCAKSATALGHQANKISSLSGCLSVANHHLHHPQQQHQPILLTNNTGGPNHTNSNNTNNNNSEQTNSDYALPFPPKWV